MGYIYLRTNRVNRKQYVGQVITKRFKERQNRWNNLNQPYAGPAIDAARAKYGIDAFDFEILKECEDDELDYWEKYYIKELNTKAPYGYNLTDGGDGTTGYTHSAETKRKISEAQKGKTTWNKGKHHSYETRKKISEAQKGEKHWFYGKHHSEETKKKISENFINRKDQSKPVLQIDKNTNKVIAEFPSAKEVHRQLGFSQGHISDCCLGKCKTHKGFIWKYAV